MDYLIDAQLPKFLCDILNKKGYNAIHVISMANGDESTDKEIADLAHSEKRIVITKDVDFYYSYMTSGLPEKLLLITTGNIKNRALFTLMRKYISVIDSYLTRYNFIELSNDGLVVHE